MSYEDKEKGIWTRDANGKDMLGLVAQNDIMILHYGWPRYRTDRDGTNNQPYWNYRWVQKRGWRGNYYWEKQYVNDRYYDVAPQNITIHAHLFAVKGGFGYEAHDLYDEDNWGGKNTRGKGISLFGVMLHNGKERQ